MKVEKAAANLVARGKNLKQSTKTKKYTVKLKSKVNNKGIKGTRLIFKVNGKSYKATTDSKGKATFKITKLTKKGTFKATIVLKDDIFYTNIVKKAKIKIY